MRDGIFRRLLVTYILILVVIIGVVSLSLSQFFKIYFFQVKQRELIDAGRQVETGLIRFNRGDISKTDLTFQINTIGRATNSRIVVFESSKPLSGALQSGLDQEMEAVLRSALNGKTVVTRKQFAKELNTYVVAVGLPISLNAVTKGAVLLFAPVYEVSNALGKVYQIIWITALIALAVGVMAIWVTARKISRPIILLSKMAEEIAQSKSIADVLLDTGGELSRLAQSFNYMKNQLAKTEQMRREFIAGVSHELRTPLTTIRGFVQGILDGVIKPDEQVKYLGLAFDEINRLTRLTNDLLELTKVDAGIIRLDKHIVNLGEIVKESVLSVHDSFAGKNIEVVINPQELMIQVDPDRLKQVLINLLHNAFKYTPEGGKVTIETFHQDGEALIKVSDTGIGIPQEEMSLIFEKFYRVDKSRDSAVRGTGLGLSIAKNLVELHGGRIFLESQEGSGSCFIIGLPI